MSGMSTVGRFLDYLLSETSLPGAPKNRFFRSMGFGVGPWEVFRDALAAHPETAALESTDTTSLYGEKRCYRCVIATPNGRNPCIRTVRQERDEGLFQLVTAYPFL